MAAIPLQISRLSQAPSIRQRWATIIKSLVNQHGLKYAARQDYSQMTSAFLDDFHARHGCPMHVAEDQKQSVLRFLTEDRPPWVLRSSSLRWKGLLSS